MSNGITVSSTAVAGRQLLISKFGNLLSGKSRDLLIVWAHDDSVSATKCFRDKVLLLSPYPSKTMPQPHSPAKRYRGYVLTHQGVDKLVHQLSCIEQQTYIRQNARAIAQRVQLSSNTGIHPMTVRKILQQQQGVDKSSIERVFRALDLSLDTSDCAHASLYTKPPKQLASGI